MVLKISRRYFHDPGRACCSISVSGISIGKNRVNGVS